MSMSIIDHVVVRVKDLDEGIASYRDKLGLTLARTGETDGIGKQAFFDLPGGGFIELVAPSAADSAVGKAIERNGEGVHTVAMAVDDLEATVAQMKDNGASIIPGGPDVAFVHPKTAHGVLLQLVRAK